MIGCVKIGCVIIGCDHSNNELKVRYSSHGLNNELSIVRNSNVSVIRMFAIRIPTVLCFILWHTAEMYLNSTVMSQHGKMKYIYFTRYLCMQFGMIC